MRSLKPLIINDIHDSQMFALAQCAGRAGIPMIATHPEAVSAPWAETSRYIEKVIPLPDLNDVYSAFFHKALMQKKITGVWLPSYESCAEYTARYHPQLNQAGLHCISVDYELFKRVDTLQLGTLKGRMKIPEQHRIAWGSLTERADQLTYPALLKVFRNDHVFVDSPQALVEHVERHNAHHKPDEMTSFQQWIEGDTKRLVTAMLLFDQHAKPVRGFTARRERVAPTRFGQFGETTAAHAEWLPDLYEAACELLSTLKWKGFAEVECKQGHDGEWYLLEINGRCSGWQCLAEADGVGMLTAYHRICSEGATLTEMAPQLNKSRYIRIFGNSYHAPDWYHKVGRHDHKVKKMARLLKAVCHIILERKAPRTLASGVDRLDPKGSLAICKHTLQWLWRRMKIL